MFPVLPAKWQRAINHQHDQVGQPALVRKDRVPLSPPADWFEPMPTNQIRCEGRRFQHHIGEEERIR